MIPVTCRMGWIYYVLSKIGYSFVSVQRRATVQVLYVVPVSMSDPVWFVTETTV